MKRKWPTLAHNSPKLKPVSDTRKSMRRSAGTVSVRATRQGEVVNPGEPIVTIIDFGDTWVRAEAPETEARFVADGDKLKVRLPAGKPIDGTVIFKAVEATSPPNVTSAAASATSRRSA